MIHARMPMLCMSPRRIALSLLALALVVSASARDSMGGEVYTMTNDPAGNAIVGFHRDAQGRLTPLPGSPYMTGGLGVTPTSALGPFDSDQEIILSADKSRLFAVNGGSNSVSVFDVADDGTLSAVPGSPFPSDGSDPASLGLSGNILVVVNQDEDPMHPGVFLPNYVTFRVSETGALSRMPISTVFTTLGASPSQALIGPKDDLVFSTDFLGGLLRSFKLSDSGALTPAALLPLPPGEFADTGSPPLPLGLAPHPDRSLLYVGFVTISRMGVYKYNEKAGPEIPAIGPKFGQRDLLDSRECGGNSRLLVEHRRREHLGLRQQARPDRSD